MLILTRRIGEKIKINDDITITVGSLSFDGKSVRLGFEAPKNITINRQEIYNRKQKQVNKK